MKKNVSKTENRKILQKIELLPLKNIEIALILIHFRNNVKDYEKMFVEISKNKLSKAIENEQENA